MNEKIRFINGPQYYGLCHATSNLRAVLVYADYYNVELILPTFKLAKFHNNNREITTKLTEYLSLIHI